MIDDTGDITIAEGLYCEGKLEEAMSLCKNIIEKYPNSYIAYNNIGVIHYELGDFNKAEESFIKAISIKKDYQDALSNLTEHYHVTNNFTAAEDLLNSLLNSNSKDVNIINRIGNLFLEAGKNEKAIEILTKSLALNPKQNLVRRTLKYLEDNKKSSIESNEEIKILHIMILDKFTPPLIDFIDKNFGRKNHEFIFVDKERYEYGLTSDHGIEFLSTIDDIFITLLDKMKEADKIILHGLWRTEVDLLLYFNQSLLKKCYWVMWGGDFYFPERYTKIKKKVIRNIAHAITFLKGDYELAKNHYNTNAEYHNCFAYLSNTFKDYSHLINTNLKDSDERLLLIGNSADPSNNHFDIFEKIRVFKNNDIKIICPLSYGNNIYAEKVIQAGKSIFGDKFKPLTEFIAFEEYIKILLNIDVAIFAHKRQQAMGNITTLLGLGKKVYLRDDISPWHLFKDINVKVYSFNNENIIFDFPEHLKKENTNKIKEYFSYENLISDWGKIFNN